MANKIERQAAILELIGARRIASQRELQKLLLQRGWDVTQATLSRDLHELRVARVPSSEGVHYEAPAAGEAASRAVLDALLPQLFLKIDGVAESIVLRTLPGGAQAIAEALDVEEWPDVVGTIAGDNTILILCRSSQARERVTRRLKSLAGVQ
jgi:transcriptional regulator of arginine metabolism